MDKSLSDVIARYLSGEYIPPREISHSQKQYQAQDDHLYVLIKTAQGFQKTLKDFRAIESSSISPKDRQTRELRLRLMIDNIERKIIKILKEESGHDIE